jgi:hypothetical protein
MQGIMLASSHFTLSNGISERFEILKAADINTDIS